MQRIFTSYPSNYVKCSQGSPRSLDDNEIWDIVSWAAQEAGLATSNYVDSNSNSWTFTDRKTHGQDIYIQLSDADIRSIVSYAQRQAGKDQMKLRSLIADEILRYA